MTNKTDYSDWAKEDLVKEIKKLKKRKKFGIVWDEEKKEHFDRESEGKLPILKEIKNKEIRTDGEKSFNILIEGDNYHALSVLSHTHKGMIDVIYIDPPYNTGAQDWKYNNDYVDINDQWRHSKWLSFMEKRLKLTKNLLNKKGVLICTIDENEHAPLVLLLQEIFYNKEVVSIVIVHNPAGVQGKNFSYVHEFANFVYPKKDTFIGKTSRDKELISPFRDWGGTSARKLAKNCFYPIIIKKGKIIKFGDICPENFHPKSANVPQKDGSIYIYPIDKNGIERKWVYSLTSSGKNKNQLSCKKIGNEWTIIRKKDSFTHRTVWDDKRYYANIYGSKLLNNIIPTKFSFPKSIYAVEDCIKAVIHDKNNAIILDFFAGSGTTGHAVLSMNKNDGGTRKFILCTNNEGKICTEICYPRVKKVIQGYTGLVDKKKYDGLGGNLKYFKTDFVDGEPTDKNKKKLVEQCTEMLCLREDCFDELKQTKNYSIFKNHEEKYFGIVYDDDGIEPLKKQIKSTGKKFNVYVFSLDDSAREEEFEDVIGMVDLKPIPEVILNVYRRIFK